MRKSTRFFSHQFVVVLALLTLSTFHACLDDDKQIQSSKIQFTAGSESVTEGKETIIYVALDKASSVDGYITVEVLTSAVYNQDFTTDPAGNAGSIALTIVKGQKTAQFKVSAIDNALFNNSKSITFSFGIRTFGLDVGVTKTCTLTIEDDEGPSVANFKMSTGFVDETNEEGIEVQIQLSSAAKGQGTMELYFISELAVYGTHFTTSPAATNNLIVFDVSQDQTSVVFKVIPINNTRYTDSLMLTFSISSVGGAVEKGNNSRYSLTIVDDEKPSIINFENSSGTINENVSDGIIVKIVFSKTTVEPGTLVVNLLSDNGSYGKDFLTEPAGFGGKLTLNVNKDQSSASFKVLPIDNSYSNYYKKIQFTLSVIDGPMKAESTLAYDLTLVDNEISDASFAESEGSINENNGSGIPVRINFSKPLSQPTQFFIQTAEYSNAFYGSAYSTNPEMTGYTIYDCDDYDYYYGCLNPKFTTVYKAVVTGQTGATSVEFRIIPIDNVSNSGNREISFSLLPSDESPLLMSGGEFTLTLVDND